ncbi:hypothetical protein Tco_1569653 [Tanacetum coccineum]
MTTSPGTLFTSGMLLIGSFSPTKVLLSHYSTPSTPIPSPDHNGLTFSESTSPSSASLFANSLPRLSLMPLFVVGLYIERESRDVATLSGLRRAKTVNSTHLIHLFWPSICDGGFNMGNKKAKSIRDPRIKLAHRYITMTITGRKETTYRVTEIDLFYLYCSYREGVICNIPYWLSKYLKGIRDKSMIFGRMFVTMIVRSFGFLIEEMISVLNREPPPHIYKKKSLVKMGVIMELHEGECCWPATKGVVEEDEGDDEEGDRERGNEGVGGSSDIYRNISVEIGRSGRRDGWTNKTTNRGCLMPGWNNKTKGLIGCMITPFASSSTCRPATTLSHTSRLIYFLGLKPTTLLMAIRDTCLPATHTALTLLRMALLDYFCFVPLLFSSLVF